MIVEKIVPVLTCFAFDVSQDNLYKIMDRDAFNMNDDDGNPDDCLTDRIRKLDNVEEVDYDGMFTRTAVFVSINMTDTIQDDTQTIVKMIEAYVNGD